MSFSPALSKQAQIAIFLLKIKKNSILFLTSGYHPQLFFGNRDPLRSSQKFLTLIVDKRLSFDEFMEIFFREN